MQVAAAGIAECHLWGSGLVVLTTANRLFAVTSLAEPRVQPLADPMLGAGPDCAPSCIAGAKRRCRTHTAMWNDVPNRIGGR